MGSCVSLCPLVSIEHRRRAMGKIVDDDAWSVGGVLLLGPLLSVLQKMLY